MSAPGLCETATVPTRSLIRNFVSASVVAGLALIAGCGSDASTTRVDFMSAGEIPYQEAGDC